MDGPQGDQINQEPDLNKSLYIIVCFANPKDTADGDDLLMRNKGFSHFIGVG